MTIKLTMMNDITNHFILYLAIIGGNKMTMQVDIRQIAVESSKEVINEQQSNFVFYSKPLYHLSFLKRSMQCNMNHCDFPEIHSF